MSSSDKEMTDAPVDVLQMNNLIVNLRSNTKKVRFQVTQKLTRKIKTLLEKKENVDGSNSKKEKRAAKLREEIKILKTLHVDEITKSCLVFKPSTAHTTKDAALSRIAAHKSMTEKVNSLREMHSDWDSLARYIVDRVTRRPKRGSFKKAKSKPNGAPGRVAASETAAPAKTFRGRDLAGTLEKLRDIGGPVRSFDVDDDDDDDSMRRTVDVPVEDVATQVADAGACKKRKRTFFEGCDDDDDDKDDKNEDDGGDGDKGAPSYGRASKFHDKKKQHPGRNQKFQNKMERKYEVPGQEQFAAAGRKSKKPEEVLHPSWEAKKKEKEKMKLVTNKPMKIVYDD